MVLCLIPKEKDKGQLLIKASSPEDDTTGPMALAKAPKLRRIPITVPFWLAEPGRISTADNQQQCPDIYYDQNGLWI